MCTCEYSNGVLSVLSLCRGFLKKCRDNVQYVFGLQEDAEDYDLLASCKQVDQPCIDWGRQMNTGSPTESVETLLVAD